jgi:hypothetical protein
MKFIIYTVFTAAILLTGCIKTEGILEIKGKVMDEDTKEQIPLRKIIVQGLVERNNRLAAVEAGEFTSDSSGCFTYSLRKVKDAYYYNFCLVGDSDYAFITREKTLFELERDALYLSFYASKLADFTIKIFRKSKTPVCDTLFLSWQSNGVNGKTLYPYKIDNYNLTTALEFIWIGGKVKSTIKTRAFADRKTKIRWLLFRNGMMKEITDTITCKRNLVNSVYFTY